jgi:hypothetical protein
MAGWEPPPPAAVVGGWVPGWGGGLWLGGGGTLVNEFLRRGVYLRNFHSGRWSDDKDKRRRLFEDKNSRGNLIPNNHVPHGRGDFFRWGKRERLFVLPFGDFESPLRVCLEGSS